MITQQEGVVTLRNDKDQLVGIVYMDLKTRHNLIYTCTEASTEDIELLLKSKFEVKQ